MDYKKIYDDLCSSRKSRGLKKESGYEIHHIILRCEGGTNDESNLVKLTYREHFLAHLLLAKSYPHKINYRLASSYFLNKKDVVGSRTYSNLKYSIAEFKRYQKYLRWGDTHTGRIKLSSFYDKNSDNLKLRNEERKLLKGMFEKHKLRLSKNNTKIHEEIFKIAILIRDMGYKGIYGWHPENNRGVGLPKPKYAFNKVKNNFIKLGVIKSNGDFTDDFIIRKGDAVMGTVLASVIRSDIDTKLGIKGLIYKWNILHTTKSLVSYRQGDKIVLEPLTPFLPNDFKYSLEIFKPITYRKAKEILIYLLDTF